MGWFGNKTKDDAEPERKHKFEDFVDLTQQQELPADAPRIDVLEREVSLLKELVGELQALKSEVASTEKWIEEWFRKRIAKLADDAAKQFDSARFVAEKVDIEQYIQQVAEAIFRREAQGLFQACVRAVLRQLGKGL